MTYSSTEITWLIILTVIFIVIFIGAFISRLVDIQRELKYINMEIKRCDDGERKIWIRRRRRLLLSLLPFVGR